MHDVSVALVPIYMEPQFNLVVPNNSDDCLVVKIIRQLFLSLHGFKLLMPGLSEVWLPSMLITIIATRPTDDSIPAPNPRRGLHAP